MPAESNEKVSPSAEFCRALLDARKVFNVVIRNSIPPDEQLRAYQIDDDQTRELQDALQRLRACRVYQRKAIVRNPEARAQVAVIRDAVERLWADTAEGVGWLSPGAVQSFVKGSNAILFPKPKPNGQAAETDQGGDGARRAESSATSPAAGNNVSVSASIDDRPDDRDAMPPKVIEPLQRRFRRALELRWVPHQRGADIPDDPSGDGAAYAWLQQHGFEADDGRSTKKLPDKATWLRYVREGRKQLGLSPARRPARPHGKSIVHPSQI